MQLTAPELEILKSLWQSEPQTGKDIHARLASEYGWSYSSTRKTLDRMVAKGTLRFAHQGNKKIYFSELEKVPTVAAYAQDFAKRVLEMDGPLPITMFSDSHLLKQEELGELEQLLKQLSNKKTQG